MRKLISLIVCLAAGISLYGFMRNRDRRRKTHREEWGHPRPGVGTMTGQGDGQRVTTEDRDGAAVTYTVGRGVI